jgi:hypothetical protein
MRRFSGGTTPDGEEITWPSISMVPVAGGMKPAIMRKVVVLPQPDGPSSETNSPLAISSEKSSTALKLPKLLPMFLRTSLLMLPFFSA